MPLFLLGPLLGGVSGGATYFFTADGQLALIVAAVVAVLAWLGVAGIIVLDN